MAKLVLITLGLAVILHLSALGQVDTLRFEEMNNFSTADMIYNTYFQDINNDNLPEMVICQASWIDIYNPLNGNRLWSSPPLDHNSTTWQAQFGDLNGDGYPDLVAIDPSPGDTSYIKAFDVIHDQLIWTSPAIHRLNDTWPPSDICAIGDRNSDGVNDIIIFTRGGVHYQNIDTAWIDIYDGPAFQLSAHQSFSILSDRIPDPDFYLGFDVMRWEELYKASIIDFSNNGQPQPKIVLFLNQNRFGGTYDGVYSFNMWKHGGSYDIFDPINLTNINITGYGGMQSYSLIENSQGETSLCSYTKYYREDHVFDPYGGYDQYYYFNKRCSEILSADGNLLHTTMIDGGAGVSDGVVGEIDIGHDGDEFCAGFLDSLMVFSFPEGQRIRSIVLTHAWTADYRVFHSESILGPPQILCSGGWQLPLTTIDGTTGEISGIFSYDDHWRNTMVDLNHDGNDENIRTMNRNEVHIYRVVNAANGINDGTGQIPSRFKLYSAYPNPFNPSTTIQYDLVKDSPVNIGIFDILGQRIETLVNQRQPAGHHQVIWNAKDVSSGIYFYKIQAGDYAETKKMVVMK